MKLNMQMPIYNRYSYRLNCFSLLKFDQTTIIQSLNDREVYRRQ